MSEPRPLPRLFRQLDQAHSGTNPSSRSRYVATGAQTDGDYGLFESELPPGAGGPGPHYHQFFSESFYVLEGQLAVLSDREYVTASAGDHLYVPREAIHGFRNASATDAVHFFILFTPGIAREQYFEGLAALHADGLHPSNEEIDEFARLHDQINIRE